MIDAKDALKRTLSNPFRMWPISPKFTESAAKRLREGGPCAISHRPRFRLSREDRFFTIGSCFARNVEVKLIKMGCDVLARGFSIAPEHYLDHGDNEVGGRGVLNKYNPHSMRTEVLRALGEIDPLPDNGFIEIGEGLWLDPQASRLKPDALPVVTDLRDKLNALTARVAEASVVFITLGLTETWYDRVTGLSLNQAPPPAQVRKMGERFYFRNATYTEAVECLEDIIRAIRKHSPDCRIIVTVSPVPMSTTWTGEDVIVANTYSKATLRAAAQALTERHHFVDYFPSYEIVVNTPLSLAWKGDGVHVRPELVSHIVDHFAALYFD